MYANDIKSAEEFEQISAKISSTAYTVSSSFYIHAKLSVPRSQKESLFTRYHSNFYYDSIEQFGGLNFVRKSPHVVALLSSSHTSRVALNLDIAAT